LNGFSQVVMHMNILIIGILKHGVGAESLYTTCYPWLVIFIWFFFSNQV